MSRTYLKPPLIEALCEFKFAPGQKWDATMPGVLWTHFQDDFPIKKERQTVEFGFDNNQAPSAQQITVLQFRREDNTALVQISDNTLIVNQLRPYPNWEKFLALIKTQLSRYIDVARPEAVGEISLRYINRLELPAASDEEPYEYCTILPHLPPVLADTDEVNVGFNQRIEMAKSGMNGVLALQTGNTKVENTEYIGFLLDISFTSLGALPLAETIEWVQLAHDQIEQAFEACLTDKAKALLQPL